MKKESKHYLIAVWHPHRGSTKENPAYTCGTGCYIAEFPLTGISLHNCYSSEKRAQRQADKLFYWPYTYCDVVEVFEESVNEEGVASYGWKYVSA